MATVTVNAIGDKCPVPVVKANKALKEMSSGILEIHVDNEIAVQNLQRMASGKGLTAVSAMQDPAHYVVTIEVTGPVSSDAADDVPICCTPTEKGTVVVISSQAMGTGSDELGGKLMKGFIYALAQLDTAPETILFYNGGAHLTTEGSASIEDLKELESRGTEILTCGTCLDYYGIKDKLAVGGVTNMYVIVEKQAKAARIIRP